MMNKEMQNNNDKINVILKFGGSIFQSRVLLHKTSKIFYSIFNSKNADKFNILILTGGGHSVDRLREEYKEEINNNPKQKEAINEKYHWEAIKLMDTNAQRCYNQIKFFQKNWGVYPISITEDPNDFIKQKNGVLFLKPSKNLQNDDPLQYSWEITSDSITIYYAHYLNLNSAILLKDIDYLQIEGVNTKVIDSNSLKNLMDITGYSSDIDLHLGKGKNSKFPIDSCVPYFINKYKINTLLLNGTNTNLLRNFLELYNSLTTDEYSKYGTLIKI